MQRPSLMENRINSVLLGNSGTILVDIFGYSSHGLPGLEIIGLGQHARAIKEKFIYLSKMRKLQIPLRRYVLCVEARGLNRPISSAETQYLECPLLLCFWSLAQQLYIPRLEGCLSAGQVNVLGQIQHLSLSSATQKKIKECMQKEGQGKIKWITQEGATLFDEDFFLLPAQEIFSSVASLQHGLLPEKVA